MTGAGAGGARPCIFWDRAFFGIGHFWGWWFEGSVKAQSEKVRVGVVGIGYFGRFHALKFAAHPNATLVGIADHHVDRLVDAASECHAAAYVSHEDLLGTVDAVSIATPADTHGALAKAFLETGAHVLVEKPLAATLAEGDALIELARAKNRVLQVGHQERAVLAEAGLFDIGERPLAISCVRKGPFTGRNIDVDVVLDLTTHDLDLVHALDASALAEVTARGGRVHSPLTDWVEAALTLEDGCRVTISASRVHDRRERTMEIVYPSGTVAIDFLARSLVNTTPHVFRDIFPATGATGPGGDPLGYALDRFLGAVQGRNPPLVSGAEARFALAAAGRIQDALRPA